MTNQQALTAALEDVGDGVRSVTGTSGTMTLAQMATTLDSFNPHLYEDAILQNNLNGPYTNDRATVIGPYKFWETWWISDVSFPRVVTIKQYAFHYCNHMTSANFPLAETVREGAFQYTTLPGIALPKLTKLYETAFRNCTQFALLDLYSPDRTTIPELVNSNALGNTLIESGSGYIVINDSLVASLKAATNWSVYSAQIISHTDAVNGGIV